MSRRFVYGSLFALGFFLVAIAWAVTQLERAKQTVECASARYEPADRPTTATCLELAR